MGASMQLSLARGQGLWGRARRVLPGGVSSNVKMEEQPQPLYFVSAKGSHLYDCDGNAYIDYTSGYGPVILGHAHPQVVTAVKEAAEKGFLFGGQHEGEVVLAETLKEIVPCVEMVRYNNSGSEAVAAAVRLARAYTRKSKLIRFFGHYHGWLDEQLVGTHPPLDGENIKLLPETEGQPSSATAQILVTHWNDIDALKALVAQHPDEIAAILMEPIMCNSGVILPKPGYLEFAHSLCAERGILLIFDEVITGFRVALGGAQSLLGVVPDLAVFGKALANGFPLSCIGGKREVLELIASGNVVHSGTFNGNPLGVAAALATIDELRRDDCVAYGRLRRTTNQLTSGIREIAASEGISILIQEAGPVFYMWFTDIEAITDYRASAKISRVPYAKFATALLSMGVRVIPGGRWYVSCSHTSKDVDQTLGAVEEAFAAVRDLRRRK